MRVIIRQAAEDDLDRIFAWFAKHNPRAAADMSVAFATASIGSRWTLAHMGRPGKIEGTRELVEYPYIIVYRVFDERREVLVLSIVHGAQDRGAAHQ